MVTKKLGFKIGDFPTPLDIRSVSDIPILPTLLIKLMWSTTSTQVAFHKSKKPLLTMNGCHDIQQKVLICDAKPYDSVLSVVMPMKMLL
jgi:hypothetical protein